VCVCVCVCSHYRSTFRFYGGGYSYDRQTIDLGLDSVIKSKDVIPKNVIFNSRKTT
jgi:hypothetical protein